MIKRMLIACLPLFVVSSARADVVRPAPEAATGTEAKTLAVATRHMVAAADPRAAEAGREILRQGGSAVDAAIAVQLVLGLVEPQSSGLGGGAFLLNWDAASREVRTYDGRETAPAAAKPDQFLRDGKPIPFEEAVLSGLSVGVPGVMRMLELAHKRHGKLAWKDLFAPAIKLADDGFVVSRRLNMLLRGSGASKFSPGARAYFFDDAGAARPEGYILKNPAYAATLRALADKGATALYEGEIANGIAAAVTAAKGVMTTTDLANYTAIERDPVCITYREHRICGMGPPSSGAITIAQTLKLIEPFESITGSDKRMTTEALHLIAEAEKLAYADRNRYIADPAFVPQPSGLLDDGYLAERRKLIDPKRAMPRAEPGIPPGVARRSFGIDQTREIAGTSHVSVLDDAGNAVSMTTTIEGAFGSHLWAAGFLLNNELTDFSFMPVDEHGTPVANAVAGGKRPRSSMAPTLVFDKNGDLEIITGSPGGSRIILYVAKTLVAMLDWGMDAESAATLVNFGSQGQKFELEFGMDALWPGLNLKAYGHSVMPETMTSGIHTIARRNGRIEGAADPRREGAALGD